MTPGFFLGVVAASFFGSLHCVGMCGLLVALADGRRASGHALYQTGRLLTLLGFGALAGVLGSGVDSLGDLAGLQNTVATVTGVTVIAWGLLGLLRGAGWHVPAPKAITQAITRGMAVVQSAPPPARALSIGLLTPFLPCGWLALFVITAAGTAHAGWGALTLAAFWAGNVPALLGVGVSLQALLKRTRGRVLPAVSGGVLVLMGALLLTQRTGFASPLALPAQTQAATPLGSAATSLPSARDQEELPCCAH